MNDENPPPASPDCDSGIDENYKPLSEALQKRSIRCYFQSLDLLVISRQASLALPFSGNSFSVCHDDDGWYLWTCAPPVSRVPEFASLLELCTEFVDCGASAQVTFSADLVQRYRLMELSPDEWESESD